MTQPLRQQEGQTLLELVLGMGILGLMITSVLMVSHLTYSHLIISHLAQRAAACAARQIPQRLCQRELARKAKYYGISGEIRKVRFVGESLGATVHLQWQAHLIGTRTIIGELSHLKGPL